MASLKAKYQGRVKFYFIEYNQPQAQDVIKEFEVAKHPTTIILDKAGDPVWKLDGYDDAKAKLIEDEIIKVLNE